MTLEHSTPRSSEAALAKFYREHLEHVILPFWLERTLDEGRGGIFNCVDDTTGRRVSDDKFVWSQARWAWTAAHASRMAERGSLDADGTRLLEHARLTADFLIENAFLENGNVAYLLSREGAKKEFLPGKGHDISYFADCFVALALAGVARATGEKAYLERGLEVYGNVRRRLASGAVRSEPYPLPAGARAHAQPMILLNVAQELERALKAFGDERHEGLAADALRDMDTVLDEFVRPDGLVTEVKVPGDESSLLARHVTPGHAIESMWFVIEQAVAHGRTDAVRRAAAVIGASFEAGWDPVHGGLYRYVLPGAPGGQPTGEADGPFEQLILDTWDTKIWWPHSETLYAAPVARAALRSQELVPSDDQVGAPGPRRHDDLASELESVHDRAFDYVFSTFPNPDAEVLEWIHIRDRRGEPLRKVVGLPVKDPYHLIRNLMFCVELLGEGLQARTTAA